MRLSVVQSRCRLDFVQHYLPIRFGRETRNKFSVIQLHKNVFLHWCQQQSFISCFWPTAGCSFDFTNANLEKPRSVGLIEPGSWPVAPDEFESGGAPAPEIVFVTVSTVWPVCCLQITVPYLVGATVCGYALRDSDKSLTLAALTRLFGSGLQSFASTPYPPFFENSSDLHQSQDRPWRRLGGGGSCPHLPPLWRR